MQPDFWNSFTLTVEVYYDYDNSTVGATYTFPFTASTIKHLEEQLPSKNSYSIAYKLSNSTLHEGMVITGWGHSCSLSKKERLVNE